jgi:hypothetical protein
MFREGHHDSIIQRGIDEALACQDMLERAPIRPSVLARVRARLAAAGHAWTPRVREHKPRIIPVTPLKVSR